MSDSETHADRQSATAFRGEVDGQPPITTCSLIVVPTLDYIIIKFRKQVVKCLFAAAITIFELTRNQLRRI